MKLTILIFLNIGTLIGAGARGGLRVEGGKQNCTEVTKPSRV